MNTNLNDPLADIRPVTRAMKQLSEDGLESRRYYERVHCRALLLLEPNCTELPATILEDTVLQPIDNIVLLIVMKIVRRSSGNVFLPTQAQLAKLANVSSPDTIWRALLILRCSRWLTVCQRMWCTHSVQSGKSVRQDHEITLEPLALDPSSTHAD